MSWTISVDEMIIESTQDGLSSSMTPIVDAWVASNENMVNVEPYPSAVRYDPKNESIVLAAHLDYLSSLGMGGPNLIILDSDTGPYVEAPDESEEIELKFG